MIIEPHKDEETERQEDLDESNPAVEEEEEEPEEEEEEDLKEQTLKENMTSNVVISGFRNKSKKN